MGHFILPYRFSVAVANAVCMLAVDGYVTGNIDSDLETFQMLNNLSLIAGRSADPRGFPCYMAVRQLDEMTPPYTRMIEEFNKARKYFLESPSPEGFEFMEFIGQQIGYGLLGSWRNYLIRREIDPNTKPFHLPHLD